jgi:hypothetical protein
MGGESRSRSDLEDAEAALLGDSASDPSATLRRAGDTFAAGVSSPADDGHGNGAWEEDVPARCCLVPGESNGLAAVNTGEESV